MKVRDAVPSDFLDVARIHRQMGMDYALPDLASPLFFVRKVVEDDEGNIVGACFLRLTAETYLFLSQDLDAQAKMIAMQAMQPEVLEAAWLQGIDDIEARIPGDLEKRFQKRLCRLGWTRNRSGWHPWTRSTR